MNKKTTKKYPMVSFIIPTYNRASYLERLINSIEIIDYPNIELIIIDDNSTENYTKTIHQHRSKNKLIYRKNTKNIYAEKSRKNGFNLSKGKYVIFCDDDDFYNNTHFLTKSVNILEKNPNISFVSGNATIYNQTTGKTVKNTLCINGMMNGLDYLREFQNGYNKPLSTFTTVFRRTNFKNNNTFFNDSSLYLISLLQGDAYFLKQSIGNYSIHNNNISSNIKKEFIIEALDSKYYIYSELTKIVKWDTIKWWTKQLKITSKFYFRSPSVNKSDIYRFSKLILAKYNCKKINYSLFCLKEILRKNIRA